jgi:hypothetical protein
MDATPLSASAIAGAKSDEELYGLLAAELTRRIGSGPGSEIEAFLGSVRALPVGLRAMAAVYELDVSLTLDDVGWHFANWYSRELANETLAGLLELQAFSHAEVFAAALEVTCKHWGFVGSAAFKEQYFGSPLELELRPLNERLCVLQGFRDAPGRTILSYWAPYARKHPERVIADTAA